MIFTTKSIIYTCATGLIGLFFYYLFGSVLGLKMVGIIIALIFAAIGYAIGTFKIPDTNAFELGRKAGGEEIDKTFIRWLKFKRKGNRIYTSLEKSETK